MRNGLGLGNSAAVPGLGNVYAPPGYAGLGSAGPQYVDLDYTYVYDVTLTADQVLPNQQVSLQTDAEFEWRVVIKASADGLFQFRFSDSQGFQLSDNYISSSVLETGGAANPFPVFPSLLFPKGGRIGIDIADLSGDTNTIQLLFRGVKRYELPDRKRGTVDAMPEPTKQELENTVQVYCTAAEGRHKTVAAGLQCPCGPAFRLLGVVNGVRQFGTIHRMDY